MSQNFLDSFYEFAKDIKVVHSVFALPFAASALIIGGVGLPSLQQAILLVACMVSARSFAMGMNRVLDAEVDAQVVRTRIRAIPSGRLARGRGFVFSLLFGLAFVVCASLLSPLAGYCSLPVLVILGAYPYWKRFSWLAHGYLGLCLGLSPIAVCVALTGRVDGAVLVLGLAIAVWTAGFDILYALQDISDDQKLSLKSIPCRFGVKRSLGISRACFFAMFVLLLVVGYMSDRSLIYYIGTSVIGAFLMFEHYLMRGSTEVQLSKNLGAAFFNVNAAVSIVFFAFSLADAWVLG